MSLFIKGMERPTWCNDCPFNDKEYDVCVATTDRRSIRIPVWEGMRLFHREKWCPLVEVPTPHGRLVDTDKLEVHDGWLSEAEGYSTHITFVYSNAIDLAPTIIEAEE